MDYKLFWSKESISNLESILSYLESEWTDREIASFKRKLSKQLELIEKNPRLFPVSDVQPRLRKAVLSKQTTIFYELKEYDIHIAYLFSNRMDIVRIK
jgi:plasmid stabilization system protein ParE